MPSSVKICDNNNKKRRITFCCKNVSPSQSKWWRSTFSSPLVLVANWVCTEQFCNQLKHQRYDESEFSNVPFFYCFSTTEQIDTPSSLQIETSLFFVEYSSLQKTLDLAKESVCLSSLCDVVHTHPNQTSFS